MGLGIWGLGSSRVFCRAGLECCVFSMVCLLRVLILDQCRTGLYRVLGVEGF